MPSLHAYLCAVDLPPNSYKPTSFIVAIEDVRTNSGAQVFRNLTGDRMHDQINCSPKALATGIDWSTVAGGEDDMAWSDIYKNWDGDDIDAMKAKGLFSEGIDNYWKDDVGTWSHDWDHFTTSVLAADAALPPTSGSAGDLSRGDTVKLI